MSEVSILQEEFILKKIYLIKGKKVMLDSDLAELYGIETKRLKEQVRRNSDRFPADFMFELTENEYEYLRSQIATSSLSHGGSRYLPMVFTEHGVLMLSSVLNSPTAIQVNIQIMRIFTKVREMLNTHKDLLAKLDKMERQILNHEEKYNKHDNEIKIVFNALKQLLDPEKPKRKKIGYKRSSER